MRRWLADVCFDIALNVTGRAEESNIKERRARLIDRAEIWHARSVWLSGLRPWATHRRLVQSVKTRAKRRQQKPQPLPYIVFERPSPKTEVA